MPNLFVLVSTGQGVANLPPVLEHAQTGDFVLWVESDEARKKHWTAGPRAVLEERGLVTAGVVEVPQVNDPVLLSDKLAPFAKDAQGQYEQVFLVANGGNKLSPIGLILGLGSLKPELLYGDDKPAVYSRFATGLGLPPLVNPYTRHDLDLPEILRARGRRVRNTGARRIWPGPLPEACAAELYGQDEPYTYDLHRHHYARAAAAPAGERVELLEAIGLVPDVFRSWDRTVQQVRTARVLHQQILDNLYNSTLKLDAAARAAVGREGLAPPAADLGGSFERAVARRVHHWLTETRHPAVQSAWMNVEVGFEGKEQSETELDVTLVLRNGVVFHLECKSAEVDVRDLETRIYRLQRASSLLATLVVVLPLFTRNADEPWFYKLCARRAEVMAARIPFLPFTWPGQPDRCPALGTDPAAPPCPTFEQALETLLGDYRLA